MLIARILHNDFARYGLVSGDTIELLDDDIFQHVKTTGEQVTLQDARLLAPVTPSLIVGLGRNYISHINEMKVPPPDTPAIFFKPGRTIIASDEAIVVPSWTTRVDYEGELGVVIGKKMRSVPEAEVYDYIFGYTCFNDITERHVGSSGLINQDISKCCDTFGPCGPWISTDFDPNKGQIITYHNDRVVQQDCTGNTVFPLTHILSYVSRFMTLMPGDLLITGTPAGIGPLHPGDTVTVEIDGIGRLTNPVLTDHFHQK